MGTAALVLVHAVASPPELNGHRIEVVRHLAEPLFLGGRFLSAVTTPEKPKISPTRRLLPVESKSHVNDTGRRGHGSYFAQLGVVGRVVQHLTVMGGGKGVRRTQKII